MCKGTQNSFRFRQLQTAVCSIKRDAYQCESMCDPREKRDKGNEPQSISRAHETALHLKHNASTCRGRCVAVSRFLLAAVLAVKLAGAAGAGFCSAAVLGFRCADGGQASQEVEVVQGIPLVLMWRNGQPLRCGCLGVYSPRNVHDVAG